MMESRNINDKKGMSKMKEEVEKIKKDLYRYKTLYEILLEENKTLKENCLNLQNRINELQQKERPKRSIIYRGLRKIYHIIKR